MLKKVLHNHRRLNVWFTKGFWNQSFTQSFLQFHTWTMIFHLFKAIPVPWQTVYTLSAENTLHVTVGRILLAAHEAINKYVFTSLSMSPAKQQQ